MTGKFDGWEPAPVPKPVAMEPTPYGTLEPKADVQKWRLAFASLQMRVKDLEKRIFEQEVYVRSQAIIIESFKNWIEQNLESVRIVDSGINKRLKDLESAFINVVRSSSESEEDYEEPYDDRSAPRDFDSQRYE